MSAVVKCWWCGTVATDTEVVSTPDDVVRCLVIEWPDHPADHDHSARVPTPEEMVNEGMQRFLRAIGAT